MKKTLFTFGILLFAIFSNAQTTGDYQTVANVIGNWNGATTWEIFNGASFVGTATPPSSANGIITIRNGASVTISTSVTADQIIIEVGGTLTQNENLTIVNGAGDDLVINGTYNWQGTTSMFGPGTGDIIIASGNFVNNGIMNISHSRFIGSISFSSAIFNNSGTINKLGANASFSGAETSVQVGTFNNLGTINVNVGVFSVACYSFANNNANINLGGGIFQNKNLYNHKTGSTITGNGSFKNLATLDLQIDQVFPSSIIFSSTNIIKGVGNLTINNDFVIKGSIEGAGSLTINANATWESGQLRRILSTGAATILTINTTGIKQLEKNLINNGTLNWTAGDVSINAANISITNNGIINISSNNSLNLASNSIFTNNGEIKKTSTGITNISGGTFINSAGKIIQGLGTINITSIFSNNGSVVPGLSPGILTLNGSEPLSPNTNLNIEIFDGSGPGTGHDQLVRAGNLTLAGILNVVETGTVPAGTYTIINLTSGVISGDFTTVNLPAGYTFLKNSTNFQLIKSSASLPITLLNFKVQSIDNQVQLTWQTTNETNFSHFEIQRSNPLTPGGEITKQKFEKIGEKKSNESNNYEFLDITPPAGVGWLYRLKMIDLDGKYSYSKTIFIENSIEKLLVGNFFPNPSQGQTLIEINTLEKGNWNITTFDLTGKLIHSETKFLQKGLNKISIEKLNQGVNFVRFENGIVSEIRKVIKD